MASARLRLLRLWCSPSSTVWSIAPSESSTWRRWTPSRRTPRSWCSATSSPCFAGKSAGGLAHELRHDVICVTEVVKGKRRSRKIVHPPLADAFVAFDQPVGELFDDARRQARPEVSKIAADQVVAGDGSSPSRDATAQENSCQALRSPLSLRRPGEVSS